jgi:hypothetical protein
MVRWAAGQNGSGFEGNSCGAIITWWLDQSDWWEIDTEEKTSTLASPSHPGARTPTTNQSRPE